MTPATPGPGDLVGRVRRLLGSAPATVGTLGLGGFLGLVFAAVLVQVEGTGSPVVAAFFTGTAAYRLAATFSTGGCENAMIGAISRVAEAAGDRRKSAAVALAAIGVATRRMRWWSVGCVVVGAGTLAVAALLPSAPSTVTGAGLGVLLCPTLAYLRLVGRAAVAAVNPAVGSGVEWVVPQALLFAVLLVPVDEDVLGVVLLVAQAALSLAAAVVVHAVLRTRAGHVGVDDAERASVAEEIATSAGDMLVVNVLNATVEQFDVIVLGLALPPEQVNAYALAKRLVGPLVVVAGGVAMHYVPTLSRTFHEVGPLEATRDLRRLRPRLALVGLAGATGVLVIGVFLSRTALDATFLTVLGILVAGQVVNVLAGPVALFLQTTGASTPMRRSSLWIGLVYVVSTFVLAPLFGAVGAGAAQSGSTILRTLWWFGIAERRVRPGAEDPSG